MMMMKIPDDYSSDSKMMMMILRFFGDAATPGDARFSAHPSTQSLTSRASE